MTGDHFDVLVVEDDADIRESMVEVLQEGGYRAAGAENGALALELLRATAPPCVILLDLMMPVMDGETFHAELLKEPAWASIPVVLMSAYRDVAERAARLQVEFLAKPIGVAQILEATRRHCAR